MTFKTTNKLFAMMLLATVFSCQKKISTSFNYIPSGNLTAESKSIEKSNSDISSLNIISKDDEVVSNYLNNTNNKSKEEQTETRKETILKKEKTKQKAQSKNLVNSFDEEPKKRYDGLSIASFIIGVLTPLFILLAPTALIFGIIGLNRIKIQDKKGKGFAIAGIVLGALGVLTLLIFLAIVIVLITSVFAFI